MESYPLLEKYCHLRVIISGLYLELITIFLVTYFIRLWKEGFLGKKLLLLFFLTMISLLGLFPLTFQTSVSFPPPKEIDPINFTIKVQEGDWMKYNVSKLYHGVGIK